MNSFNVPPTWFRAACWVALLWMLTGVASFVMDVMTDEAALARLPEAVGLDSRQAHQVLDDPQHPRGFRSDGPGEFSSEVRRDVIVRQRFRKTADRGERGAKLVAGIGDEIDAHSFGSDRLSPVTKAHQELCAGNRANSHRPRAFDAPDPGQFEVLRLS